MAKREVSLELDEDLVEELQNADETLSVQVNEAIRLEVERRKRHRLLSEWMEVLDAEDGPVPDEIMAKWRDLL